jgi:hypothetical protein
LASCTVQINQQACNSKVGSKHELQQDLRQGWRDAKHITLGFLFKLAASLISAVVLCFGFSLQCKILTCAIKMM